MSMETVLKYSVRDDTSFVTDSENAELIEEGEGEFGIDLQQMSIRDNNLALYELEYVKCRGPFSTDNSDSDALPSA